MDYLMIAQQCSPCNKAIGSRLLCAPSAVSVTNNGIFFILSLSLSHFC